MSSSEHLQKAVAAILKSYELHADLERIGKKRLPSKEEIVALVQDIQMLIYPGFIRQESLEPLNLPYVIGQKTVSIYHRLKTYLEQVLCWEVAQEGVNCKENPDFESRVDKIALEFIDYIPQLRDILAKDVDAIFEGDPAARSKQEVVLGYPGLNAITIHRIAHFFYQRQIPLLPRIMNEFVHSQTGIDIHPGAKLGIGTMIDHGTGIVIGETAEIGDKVRIYQGVTLGALSPSRKQAKKNPKRHPTIESNVVLYAGATILGGNTVVGAGSIIGGNVWLTKSVPPNSRIVWEANDVNPKNCLEEMMLDFNNCC